MCGICGRYNFTTSNKVYYSEIKAMADKIVHRGPDEEGFYIKNNIGFGHRRLSIIDIDNGQQPMTTENENFIIVYNGEIYNYFELRQELMIKGYKFITNSDTEVLLKMYIEYGEKCLEKLNGMFSFTIYDKKRNQLFCARDRLGIKPFYYYLTNDSFIFASEIKAILVLEDIEIELNYQSLQDYFALQFTLGAKTFYKNIKKLLPGYYLIVKDGKININQYWDLDYSIDTYHTEDYFIDQLLVLIQDAVRLRLRSDVSLGAHLSGGFDSSTVTILASQLLNSNIKTFTGAFSEGKDFDETKYAKIVSKMANSQYFEIRPDSSDFVESFEDIIYYMDEPTAGPGVFPQYFLSKLASENVKVVLGGQGGDEVFGGYIRYLVAYFEQCIKGAIYETNEEGEFVVDINSVVNNLPYLKQYVPLMKKFWAAGLFESMDRRYFYLIQRIDDLNQIINMDIFNQNYSVFEEYRKVFEKTDAKSYFNKMTYFDLKTFLPSLLHVEDRTSMANSLESRVPLLDHRIIELVASIPPTIKFQAGEPKYIFKRAIKNIIPEEIYYRKNKMGFPVPFNRWFRNDLKDYVYGLLWKGELVNRGIIYESSVDKLLKEENKYGRQIWGLLSLEVFFRNLKRMRAG